MSSSNKFARCGLLVTNVPVISEEIDFAINNK
jgi:hypothetical protein